MENFVKVEECEKIFLEEVKVLLDLETEFLLSSSENMVVFGIGFFETVFIFG